MMHCKTSAKYFHNSIGDFHTNKAGQNINLDPQDDGYRCKAAYILPNALGVIGSINKIKFLKSDTATNTLTETDLNISESVKIIDVDIDPSLIGRIYVAY